MDIKTLDQYAGFAKKASLSAEEQAVKDAIVAVSAAEGDVAKTVTPAPVALTEANDTLEDSQEALVAKPSTTV